MLGGSFLCFRSGSGAFASAEDVEEDEESRKEEDRAAEDRVHRGDGHDLAEEGQFTVDRGLDSVDDFGRESFRRHLLEDAAHHMVLQ